MSAEKEIYGYFLFKWLPKELIHKYLDAETEQLHRGVFFDRELRFFTIVVDVRKSAPKIGSLVEMNSVDDGDYPSGWNKCYVNKIALLLTREKEEIIKINRINNGINKGSEIMKDKLINSVKKGAEQATVNQTSELLFGVFRSMMGDNVPDFFNTDLGKELAKSFVAFGIMGMSEHLNLPASSEVVSECAQLQIQTSSMRILEPHIEKLKEAGLALVNQNKKLEE